MAMTVRLLLVVYVGIAAAVYQMSYEAVVLYEGSDKNDDFGKVVSISGNLLAVGAPGEDVNGTDAGAVYVYSWSGAEWLLDARLVSSDIAPGDFFGNSVKMSGDHLIVGAEGHDDSGLADVGSAYVFRKSSGAWEEQAKLVGSDSVAGDKFGIAVSITEAFAIVGADWHTGPGGTGSGAAYVFAYDGSWNQEAKLVGSDSVAFDRFGGTVAISDGTVVVGAVEAEDNGAAYIFERTGYAKRIRGLTRMARYAPGRQRFRTGSGACSVARAMAGGDAVPSRAFWRDDEIICDRDGIPHFTGVQPHLMKEYRRRVLFAFSHLDEDEEAAGLKKKQQRFAKRLIDGLHGEAWRAVQSIKRESDRRAIFTGQQEHNQEGIEQALRVSFFNLHDKEKEEDDGQSPSVEIIEEAEMESKWESNMGASIYNAFIAMDDQRRTYKDDRCRRRARCASCGQIGHWAGDAACHKPSTKKGSKGKRKPKMAYLAMAEIRFFTLDEESQDEDAYSWRSPTAWTRGAA
ncbi:unnamed protein product [Effrenium voratum]|uniref:Uncharacterized protein n=1 Tax=Effrenium voratum TaxID=2562239 RepID=A0AA36JHG1_9DINO|nr:unnamed protein product [Effrenium voratum]